MIDFAHIGSFLVSTALASINNNATEQREHLQLVDHVCCTFAAGADVSEGSSARGTKRDGAAHVGTAVSHERLTRSVCVQQRGPTL